MRIVLIEDQALLSSTLIKLLTQVPDLDVVAHSEKATDVHDLCREHQPDLVMMDVFTREGNGIEETARLKQAYPHIKVLVLTGVEDTHLVRAADAAGADMLVWKNTPFSELVAFIHNTKNHYRMFPDTTLDRETPSDFSDTDLQILNLLAKGKSAREVAAEMYLGYGTIRMYISKMYAATGMKTRAQLVAHALGKGLIDQD